MCIRDSRKDLCAKEIMIWKGLGDKGLRDSRTSMPSGVIDAKIRRYYDPVKKDGMIAALQSEPSVIDGKLEIVNATTDLLE